MNNTMKTTVALVARYIGTEAWSPLEVVQGGEVTSKADIFALGLVLYEMLALHSPHVDKLCVDSDADSDADESVDETAFRAALGSRPLLPDTEQLDHTYRTVLEIFFAATDADPDKESHSNISGCPIIWIYLHGLPHQHGTDDNWCY